MWSVTVITTGGNISICRVTSRDPGTYSGKAARVRANLLLEPGVDLVVGTGASGRVPVMEEVKGEAQRRKVEPLVLPTTEAIEAAYASPGKHERDPLRHVLRNPHWVSIIAPSSRSQARKAAGAHRRSLRITTWLPHGWRPTRSSCPREKQFTRGTHLGSVYWTRGAIKPASLRRWRRERDSNPRAPFEANGFQDRRFQPLTHPSSITYGRCRSDCSRNCSGLLSILQFFDCASTRLLIRVNVSFRDLDGAVTHHPLYGERINSGLPKPGAKTVPQ